MFRSSSFHSTFPRRVARSSIKSPKPKNNGRKPKAPPRPTGDLNSLMEKMKASGVTPTPDGKSRAAGADD